MMSRYKNDSWVNLVQIDNSDMKESCNIIEFCRTALLFTLNELILKYGQDFKNEQWVLEPFADMVLVFQLWIPDLNVLKH